MSGIFAATSSMFSQWISPDALLLRAIAHLYHHYHLGLIAAAALPLCLAITATAGWRWQKQRSLLALLEEAANVDHLTQMNNRVGLNLLLTKELSRAQRYKTSTSVLMIDIDHFKTINELYGQKIGDRVILHIGKTVRASLRLSDTIGRFGGEEFMIILPETSEDQAALIAERLRKTILENPLMDDAEPVIASVSIGVASYDNNIESPFRLISHSDQALHFAKNKGRNQVQCWATH